MKTCLQCGVEIPELKNICDDCKSARKASYNQVVDFKSKKELTILDFISISSALLLLAAIINMPLSKIGSIMFIISAALMTPAGKSKVLGPFMKQPEFKWYQSGFVAFVLFIVCSIVASGTPNKFEPDPEVLQAIANATPTPEPTPTPKPTDTPRPEPTPTPDKELNDAGASPAPSIFGGVDEAKEAFEKELGGQPEYVKWLGITLDRECDGRPCWRVKAILRFNGQEGAGYAYMRYGKVLKTKFE